MVSVGLEQKTVYIHGYHMCDSETIKQWWLVMMKICLIIRQRNG